MLECSQSEAAAVLNFSTRTLAKKLKQCPTARVLRPQGRVNVDLDSLHGFLSEVDRQRWEGLNVQQGLQKVRSERAERSYEGAADCAEGSAGGSEPEQNPENFIMLRNAFQSQKELVRRLEKDNQNLEKNVEYERQQRGGVERSRRYWQGFGLAVMALVAVLCWQNAGDRAQIKGGAAILDMTNHQLAAMQEQLSRAEEAANKEAQDRQKLTDELLKTLPDRPLEVPAALPDIRMFDEI